MRVFLDAKQGPSWYPQLTYSAPSIPMHLPPSSANTVSGLDPLFYLFLLFHMLFPCHLHFIHQCLFILQESIWMSPPWEIFPDSTSLTHHRCSPLPHTRPGPGTRTHDPTKHLRVSAESALSLTGPWGFCKPGLDFSVVFFQHLAYFPSFQWITSTQKCIQHSYSQE